MSVKSQDEFMHPNTGEPTFNESMYFNFYDPRVRSGGFVRIGNRPNEGYAEVTLALYRPDGTALFNFLRPRIEGNDRFAAGGMEFEVLEPLRRLRVRYAGPALFLADPLALEDPKRAFTTAPRREVELALEFEGLSPMYGGENPVADPEMEFARGHYEQHVRAAGRLAVDGETLAIEGLGLRDHSWGPRSWQSPKYYRWLTGEFDAGFGFMGSQIVTGTGRELLSGFVFADGKNHFVPRLEVRTEWKEPGHYHDRIHLVLHSEAGTFAIEGRVLGMLPLRNRRSGRVTRISEGLTEWRCQDRVGYGLSEYLDQIA